MKRSSKQSFNRIGYMIIAMALVIAALPSEASLDILCSSTKQRFDVPAACLKHCPGNFWARCALAPTCKALQKDKALRGRYNGVVFMKLLKNDAFTKVLIIHIINKYYKPINAKQFDITITESMNEWAKVKSAKVKGKYKLQVAKDLFLLSPAMIVSCIGHEMIHALQYERKLHFHDPGLDKAVEAFLELEASSWETLSSDKYMWEIGRNRFYECLLPAEKEEVKRLFHGREEDVKKAINSVRQVQGFRLGLLTKLQKWLEMNPWTRDCWLPKHGPVNNSIP